MSLIEETDDSTHERTGQGELEAAFPPPPPSPSPPKFRATQIFSAATETLEKPIFTKAFVFRFVFFFFESDIFFILSLSRRGKAS